MNIEQVRESIIEKMDENGWNSSDEIHTDFLNFVMNLWAEEPNVKAKEIALQAAISNKPNYFGSGLQQQQLSPSYNLIAEAEKIYQWLIKTDKEEEK